MTTNVVATNRKAYRDYEILDKWECGIVLTGGEVKSVRAGEVNFADSFARLEGGEIFLHSLHISPYNPASFLADEPDRARKLLLKKKEIKKLLGLATLKGIALIPTKIYFNKRGFAKVELAMGKGKRQYDKRQDIKKRAIDREIQRTIRSSRP